MYFYLPLVRRCVGSDAVSNVYSLNDYRENKNKNRNRNKNKKTIAIVTRTEIRISIIIKITMTIMIIKTTMKEAKKT